MINSQDLSQHQWKHRLLLIKASDNNSKACHEQMAKFTAKKEEMAARKLLAYVITGTTYKQIDFDQTTQPLKSRSLSTQVAKTLLNEQYEFEVILIGLDGGVKLRKTDQLTTDELFRLIDSMPMRRWELEKN